MTLPKDVCCIEAFGYQYAFWIDDRKIYYASRQVQSSTTSQNVNYTEKTVLKELQDAEGVTINFVPSPKGNVINGLLYGQGDTAQIRIYYFLSQGGQSPYPKESCGSLVNKSSGSLTWQTGRLNDSNAVQPSDDSSFLTAMASSSGNPMVVYVAKDQQGNPQIMQLMENTSQQGMRTWTAFKVTGLGS